MDGPLNQGSSYFPAAVTLLVLYSLAQLCSDCMGISVEVEDYVWIRRIVEKENLARSSSDCVVISGDVETCTRICRIV